MLPKDFLERMSGMLGEEYPAFLESYNQERIYALRVNPLKADIAQFYAHAPFTLTPVPWEPCGFYYGAGEEPGKHPCHAAGVYYIQEASAMASAAYLKAAPGERILDLCAAPGGKSTQIAALMRGQGLLISNEIHPGRAKILSENIERMGIQNCIVTNETPENLATHFEGYFDRIMVDAPCSGEGMFRKNESACDEWSAAQVSLCADRQLAILSCAASMLRPGGRMMYSTCTFAPEENEGVISRFLHSHPEFTIAPLTRGPGMSAGNPKWVPDPAPGLSGAVRLFPHRLRGEGHFLALLLKADGSGPAFHGLGPAGREPDLSEQDLREYAEFRDAFLRAAPSGKMIRFGEQLYLLPEEAPTIRGLKVLRPGLHLGTIKKNRFEPGHALALALSPESASQTLSLSSADPEIGAYLSGQTLRADTRNGWVLITVDGYSVGWGKSASGIIKNHYPKGLRHF